MASSNTSRTIAPGLYALHPLGMDEDDAGNEFTRFPLEPAAYHNSSIFGAEPDCQFITIDDDAVAPGEIVDSPAGPAGALLIGLDVGDEFKDYLGCTSVNSPLGPLSICDRYALFPVASRDINDESGGQDATNWLVLDIAEDTTISVNGGRILIGGAVLDIARGPDFSTMVHTLDDVEVEWLSYPKDRNDDVVSTKHVIRAGTELHSLLMGMITDEDDGCHAMLSTDAAGLAAVRAIDTVEARVVAKELVRFEAEGSIGTVLHFHVHGPVLCPEILAARGVELTADLVNA